MKLRNNYKLIKKSIVIGLIIYTLILPFTMVLQLNALNIDFSDDLNSQANDYGESSILWKLGKALPGTGATMKPRLVNLTQNGEALIIVGTDKGLASITLDGFINMSYRTFGPVIDFDVIEDISGDEMDDIVLVTYYKAHPNLIAIASNNGSEIWKFKATIEGISTETYASQDFITYTWDLEAINDINEDSVSDIIIASWNRIFAVDGKLGTKIWMREGDFSNDIWKLEVFEDISNNGFDTIVAGSEDGKLSAFDSKGGKKLWTFKVEEMKIPIRTMYGISKELVPNSIDDIKIIRDINDDEIDDILIAADDGYLRLISGKSGLELDNAMCYNVTQILEASYISDISTSPYSSVRRLFMKSGIKIMEIPDINNDGYNDYISIASDLDYGDYDYYYSSGQKPIMGKIFNINSDLGFQHINITYDLNWTYQNFYLGSYPEIIISNSGISIYYYLFNVEEYYFDHSSGSAQINRYDINDVKSQYPKVVYNDPGQYISVSSYLETETSHYFLNLGDLNSDGSDELFAISANGRYLCIDTKNDNILWVRTNKDSELTITEINDLNNDGFKELLVKQITDFEPDWISSNEYDFEYSSRKPKIISGLFNVDGKTGNIIWSFDIGLPQYYEGIRDLKNIEDVTDDGIDDYVGWVIPSSLPPDVSEIITNLSGEDGFESENEESIGENIYRALLSKYTKILAINGSNGMMFWNNSFLGFPYKFYRQYEYNGTYENPKLGYSTGNNYYNRINGPIPSSWGSSSYMYWEDIWEISTMLHPSSFDLINGTTSDTIFDLWGDEGMNFTITSTNSSKSSKSLKIGTTLNSTSIGTVKSEDSLFWVLNSISPNGVHEINAELSFNLTQKIESELQQIAIDYEGFVLKDEIDRIDIYIYNFSNGGNWVKISDNTINDAEPVRMLKFLSNINGLTSGENELVKIKIEAKNASAFTLFIDKLAVNYTYVYGNYTIMAEQDGTFWKAIMDLIIPIDFSDDESLGVIEYPLSQIDRFSALKLQTKLKVNTSDSQWYNFTYEIYDASNDKWVLCNWSDTTPTWNNHTYPDLRGFYDESRTNYKDFNFNYEYDHMGLITRGTNDESPYLELDHENRTTLSNFIDPNKNIRIRLNITNGNKPFNLTLDNFGIGAFYWGLFSSQYDSNYLLKYKESEWEEDEWDLSNLLNLEVQDFEVINGTNDKYLDIVSIIGLEGVNNGGSPEEEWSTRIRLFDIKNKQVYTKWSLNKTYIPYKNVRILPINNSPNNVLLSGLFQYGNNYNFSHKLISNPYWKSEISHFENYSETKVKIDFTWEEIPEFPTEYYSSSYLYEFPEKATISKDGKLGIILGEYELSEEGWDTILSNIRIVDVNSRATISKISARYLESYINQEVGRIDFSTEGAGYRLLICYEDFNDDGFLDHVGFYYPEMTNYPEMMNGGFLSGTEIRIYSGNSGDSDPTVLYSNFFEEVQFSSKLEDSINTFAMPFASVNDLNQDGIPEAVIGFQSGTDMCRGSYLSFYDIFNSNENQLDELTDLKWELDPLICLSRYATKYYEYVFEIDSIGDINADNISEIYINRKNFIETRGEYGYRNYEQIPMAEILDINNRNTLYRFNMEVNSIQPFIDLNEDGRRELFISSEEILYCINSKFEIQILQPKDQKSMSSHNFNIKWQTESDYDYFEVFIDGVSQGPTIDKKIHVSLGSGWKQISIMMYDKSGLINALSSIRVLVPSNQTQLILTFVFLGAVVGLYLFYRRYKKKSEEMILIDKKVTGGDKKK